MTAEATRAGASMGLGLGTVLLVACAAGTSGRSEAIEHPFQTVVAATYSGVRERRREVVRDEASWVRLWSEIRTDESLVPPPPAVDFTQHMLILVALGSRTSGGFGVRVRSVTSRGETLEVEVLESCPAPGTRVTLAITQPVEVVRVPRLAQTPSFRETRAASCR